MAFNPLQSALNMFSPQQITSPLPQNDTLNTPDRMNTYKNALSQIGGLQQVNPSAPVNQDTLKNYYMDYGQLPNNFFKALMNYNKSAGNPIEALGQGLQQLVGGNQTKPQVLSAQTQSFNPDQKVPSGIDLAMNYLKSQTPNGQDPKKYFKALQDPDFMNKLQQADKMKPGLANTLLLQGFNESTLGNKSDNIFGALPGGEGSGKSAGFNSPSDALDYQLSQNVLGGGGNPNMNIMGDKNPLTLGRIQQLYKSYNPEGSYINPMLQTLSGK